MAVIISRRSSYCPNFATAPFLLPQLCNSTLSFVLINGRAVFNYKFTEHAFDWLPRLSRISLISASVFGSSSSGTLRQSILTPLEVLNNAGKSPAMWVKYKLSAISFSENLA